MGSKIPGGGGGGGGILNCGKNNVSSAKNFTLDLMLFSGSLMKIYTRRGPKTDPCGTPELVPDTPF